MSSNLSKKIIQILLYEGGSLKKNEIAKTLGVKPELVNESIPEMEKLLDLLDLKLLSTESSLEIVLSDEINSLISKNKLEELKTDLSESALQTLSVIIYKDRATKPEIDFIRGVESGRSLKNLQNRGIIEASTEKNRKIFSVTTETLKYLNIENVRDIKDRGEINTKLKTLIEGE